MPISKEIIHEQVLIIDDDPEFLEIYAYKLRRRQIQVIGTLSLDKAKPIMEEGVVKRVIIDGLPGWKDAVEAAQTFGLKPKVVSGDPDIVEEARRMKIPSVLKGRIDYDTL